MANSELYIDLEAVAANWRALDALTGDSVETAAVVKANAYGLGAGQVSRRLAREGARTFFVASVVEGVALRTALGPGPRIHVLNGHMPGTAGQIAQARLSPVINSVDQILMHLETLPDHGFALHLDTGMNRLGLDLDDWTAVAELALRAKPDLVMSHLACADEAGDAMNARQLKAFHHMTDGIAVPRSLSATGGILLGPAYHFDLCRTGIGMYGGQPFDAATPAVQLTLAVIQCRDIAAGETVGYGASWTAQADSRIATVGAGYADGLFRSLASGADLYAGAVPCPVVGRISMDTLCVDISHLESDPVSLTALCAHQGIDDLAQAAGTIGYEILTSLGARYARRYRGDTA
jgi:alanine racemase